MKEQMSRQEQLDWIVRNLADKELTIYEMVYCEAGIIKFSEDPSHNPNIHSFTLGEVEQRKAELQNKPKISDIPDWANWRAQESDGAWWWHENKPHHNDPKGAWFNLGMSEDCYRKGEVIGDWRDTLEEIKRAPKIDKDVKDQKIIEEFKRMVKEDVASLLKEKSYKDWDCEGFPPVGCIAQTSVGQCVILAVDENRKEAAVQWLNDGALGVVNMTAIKPIKSERDRWIDEAAARMGTFKGSECEWYLAAVYDSLVNGYLEMPKLAKK